jgi:tRNA dimethylallyltransferase
MSVPGAHPPVIFLMGPTASGKTAAACALVERFNCEIVSVDSALVYRGMDIGTAKPNPAVLARYPHWLVNIRDPAENYSAGQFRDDALAAIDSIARRGRTPLLVGGTGLYFRTLEHGITTLPKRNDRVRNNLQQELQEVGLSTLHLRLKQVDPVSAARIDAHDTQRILRALEVFEVAGTPMSTLWRTAKKSGFPFHALKLVLAPSERSWLHDRIRRRFSEMLAAGFVNEVAALRERGDLSLQYAALRTVGYRAIWHYLDGEYSYEEMVERGIVATRQLAKRQFTWFRGVSDSKWVDSDRENSIEQLAMALKLHLQYN